MNAHQAVVKYCVFKSIDKHGVLKYGYYKKLIGYILETSNENFIRKIFLDLVTSKHFIKIKNLKKSYKYLFNCNPEIEYIKPEVDPSRFIVTWD